MTHRLAERVAGESGWWKGWQVRRVGGKGGVNARTSRFNVSSNIVHSRNGQFSRHGGNGNAPALRQMVVILQCSDLHSTTRVILSVRCLLLRFGLSVDLRSAETVISYFKQSGTIHIKIKIMSFIEFS